MKGDRFLWIYLGSLLALGVVFVIYLLGLAAPFSIFGGKLGACEDAIKEHLKAPATYERIDYTDYRQSLRITYEAQNSFGVPLRSSGYCRIDEVTGTATWIQWPSQ